MEKLTKARLRTVYTTEIQGLSSRLKLLMSLSLIDVPPHMFQIFLFCTYIVLYILYMMTSVVSNPARGTRDRALPTTTQTTHPQKQIQVSFIHTFRLATLCTQWTFGSHVIPAITQTNNRVDMCVTALFECRPQQNRFGLPRWSMTKMMLTLRIRSNRWVQCETSCENVENLCSLIRVWLSSVPMHTSPTSVWVCLCK